MQEEYVKETALIEKNEVEKEEEIIANIIKVKKDLEIARRNFEYAKSRDLVDYYIYQIKANQSKLDYLIKLAKAKGLFVNILNEVEIRLDNMVGWFFDFCNICPYLGIKIIVNNFVGEIIWIQILLHI